MTLTDNWDIQKHISNILYFFFFQAEDGIRDLTVTGVQTCALPISSIPMSLRSSRSTRLRTPPGPCDYSGPCHSTSPPRLARISRWNHTTLGISSGRDRKSTRLNSSHSQISYAVFCLKKKKKN